ncbi:acyl-CoA dehydrogenase family protein [Microbispora sp. H10830]|uniref:acyl-CoA dehydrogenase family protein n=1 Tax=Microbispora sp. H10830 TaxID=2729109 RepID=UPI0016042A76|nr:acyl-CoA dehydrogenase family protein [Microbispora sp. H10830]
MSVTKPALDAPTGPWLEPGPLPGDFYACQELLSGEERTKVERVREFARAEIAPIVNDYWARAEFPFEIIDRFRELGPLAWADPRSTEEPPSNLLTGFTAMEIAHADASIATFFAVHSGLAMGSIRKLGSEEQRLRWLPPMSRFEQIGAFALTEPSGGSDVSRGMETTARRQGGTWILDGAKRWIGNATFADLVIVWARDVETGHVLGFVVEKDMPGFHATKIQRKMALRIVQNADILLDKCCVPEANRLQNANSFRDTAEVLRATRAGVAWEATGLMLAAYEIALAYAKEREQFGRPIATFQMMQDLLVRMLGNVTASLTLCCRLAQLQDAGVYRDEQSSLAKAMCTERMRETVGWARELLAGNGIVLDYNIGRFVADAEAIYSYEGTREINTLIVGRAVTGLSAFAR